MIHFKDTKTKSALSTRWAQMTKQEQIIERKKMEIHAKLESQKQAAALAAQAKLSHPISKDDKGSVNIFSNDGSFMNQFKALLEKQKQTDKIVKEELEKSVQNEEEVKPVKHEVKELIPPMDNEFENQHFSHGNDERRKLGDRGQQREKHRRWNDRGRPHPHSPTTPVLEERKKHIVDNKNSHSIPALMQIPVMPPNTQSIDSDHSQWHLGSKSDEDADSSGEQGPNRGLGTLPPGIMGSSLMGPGPGMGPGSNMGPGPGMGPGSNMGPGPGMGPGSKMGPGPGMGPGSNMGPGPGMGPGSNMGPGPGPNLGPGSMGPVSNMGPGPNIGPGSNMGPGKNMGPGPNMGPGHNMGPGPNMGPGGPNMGPRPGMGPGPMMGPRGPMPHMPPGPMPPFMGGPPNFPMPPNFMGPNGPGPCGPMPPNMCGPNMGPGGPGPNGPMPPFFGPPFPNPMMGPNGPPNSMMPPNSMNNSNMPFMGGRPPFGPNGPPNFGNGAGPPMPPFMPPNSMPPNSMPIHHSDSKALENTSMKTDGMPRPMGLLGNPDDMDNPGRPFKPSQVLSADALPPTVLRAASEVACNGDHWENVLKAIHSQDQNLWFLHNTNSNEYKAFRDIVNKIRRDTGDKKPEVNPEDKYEPEFSLEDDDSNEDYRYNNKDDSRDGFGYGRPYKREQASSQSDEESDSKRERRKKKKSRWSDDPPAADIKPPGVMAPLPTMLPGANFPKIEEEAVKVCTVNRNNQALMQYAMTNYGTTNLSVEDWKKCEDNFKLNLLYQDMLKKRQEVERLAAAGKYKYEYDSDEDIAEGTWEHKLRAKEMNATEKWADELTKQAAGKHHIGDFLPPEELRKFMEKYSAFKSGKEPDLSDYKEFKLKEDNVGFKMLQKLGWTEGQGLGAEGSGIVEPINKANQPVANLGLGASSSDGVSAEDDEFDAYRKRMMLAYRFRPNPLNNPRRPYY